MCNKNAVKCSELEAVRSPSWWVIKTLERTAEPHFEPGPWQKKDKSLTGSVQADSRKISLI